MRTDLNMPSGKLASQAGHAFLESYLECLQQNAEVAREYNTS